MSRTGVGLVGCGNISDIYAAKLSALPAVDFVACADFVPERAKALAEKHGVSRTLSPDALVADEAVELVVNLPIPAAHQPVSLQVVGAGKSVFCEKPLALSLADGVALRLAQRVKPARRLEEPG